MFVFARCSTNIITPRVFMLFFLFIVVFSRVQLKVRLTSPPFWHICATSPALFYLFRPLSAHTHEHKKKPWRQSDRRCSSITCLVCVRVCRPMFFSPDIPALFFSELCAYILGTPLLERIHAILLLKSSTNPGKQKYHNQNFPITPLLVDRAVAEWGEIKL